MSDKQKITWTPEQNLAITNTNTTLLVSAAAGSGKTATLVERIMTRIRNDKNTDISKMLIVSYSRASTADLKKKITKAINEIVESPKDEAERSRFTSQLTKLGSARISTIDSFCYDLLKSNFTAAGVSPTFRILDPNDYVIISKRVMLDVIDEFYEKKSDFPVFMECFTDVKSHNSVYSTFLSLYDELLNLLEGIDYVKIYAERLHADLSLDIMQTSYGKLLSNITEEILSHYHKYLSEALAIAKSQAVIYEKYGDTLEHDVSFISSLLDKLKAPDPCYTSIASKILSYNKETLSPIKGKNASADAAWIKKLHAKFIESLNRLALDYYSYDENILKQFISETQTHLTTLYELLFRFEEKMVAEKERLDVLTFKDLSRLSYKILYSKNGELEEKSEIAKNISKQFTDVFIDEYQDADPIQDKIFSAISTETNRFMVGDIKQSIYKFRGSDPSLFSKYRNAFPSINNSGNSKNATIFMSDNFRCDKTIIDFANFICAPLFKSVGGCVNYQDEDDLHFSRDVDDNYVPENVQISVIETIRGKTHTPEINAIEGTSIAAKWQAEYIALKISELIGTEKKFKNKKEAEEIKNEEDKKVKASDIVVLSRKNNFAPYIANALKRRGIKSIDPDAKQYFENEDVLLMLCVLNAIDNPEKDIPLAGALRSPLFNFTPDDLYAIHNSEKKDVSLFSAICDTASGSDSELSKKCESFLNTLRYWQESAKSLPIDKFLIMLFNTDIFIASGILSNKNQTGEGGNVLLLYDYARSFQNGSFKGLYEFICYINSLITENTKFSATSGKSESNDGVKLMTFHKSKGLESYACFVCTNNSDMKEPTFTPPKILFSPTDGIAMMLADKSSLAKINTPFMNLISNKKSNDSQEDELRLIYVALTRAITHLHIVSTTSSSFSTLENNASFNSSTFDRYTVISECKTYLDWIMLFLCNDCPDYVTFRHFPCTDLADEVRGVLQCDQDSPENASIDTQIEDKELLERLLKAFNFKYEYSELSKVPSKVSVSELNPSFFTKLIDTPPTTKKEKNEFKPVPVPDFFTNGSPKPSSAERGTATHLFMQFCDFDYISKRGIDEELARLCDLRFLPSDAPSLIYLDELKIFAKSELFNKILSAKQIVREQRFNISLPLDDFNVSEDLKKKMSGTGLAVQGVIDLVLIDENGDIHLYDYKTDRLRKEELTDYRLAQEKFQKSHANQLRYYAQAIALMYGKECSSVQIYSTCSGLLYDIDLSPTPAQE